MEIPQAYQDPYCPHAAEKLLASVKKAVDVVRSKGDNLPVVTGAGAAQSGRAEEIYFERDRGVGVLKQALPRLRALREGAAAAAAKCSQRMHNRTESASARENPGEAQVQLALQYERDGHQAMKSRIQQALASAEAALREAAAKPWPLGQPKGPFGETPDYDPNAPVVVVRNGRQKLVHPDLVRPYCVEEAEKAMERAFHGCGRLREGWYAISREQLKPQPNVQMLGQLRNRQAESKELLGDTVGQLTEYASDAEKEVRRIEHNMATAAHGETGLKGPHIREEVGRAVNGLRGPLERNRHVLAALRRSIDEAQQALRQFGAV